MPSHIFARLGLWQDDINSNLASVAATRKTAAMHMGGEGHQFHAMDFLVYAYLQSGREAEAAKIIEEVKVMPKMKSMYGDDFDPQTSRPVAFPALYDLELRHWSDAAALTPVPNALPRRYRHHLLGTCHRSSAQRQSDPGAQRLAADRDASSEICRRERKPNSRKEPSRTIRKPRPGFCTPKAKTRRPSKFSRTLADKNDKLGDEPQSIPAREMLADLLLEAKRPQQALSNIRQT